ncbi:MAG: alpha mannosidase-like protein, partial [Candelina submexicana]
MGDTRPWDVRGPDSDPETVFRRQEAVDIFYHGYDNYLDHAFPEDELRPITCSPLTRDRGNPSHVELNDALGNYSLTLIDSLSTLAILASSSVGDKRGDKEGNKALRRFQDAVALVVRTYGDGTQGRHGQGTRARGFDLDSKVQVFETVIRGLGGLLSAHLFAIGELPIRGYHPVNVKTWRGSRYKSKSEAFGKIKWSNGFSYDGQLLRLAHDLGNRLLPAFYTSTGMPYPRVNLRHGIPFYNNSPLHFNAEIGQCPTAQPSEAEVTETCSAGSGSLILEFSTLSRLTGDGRFEQLAKRAFWSIWNRRSIVGLVGAGIDAETGQWIGSYTGIGAGIDSFFEYAMKTHVLLSGLGPSNLLATTTGTPHAPYHPNELYPPLSEYDNAADTFLVTWREAHSAIKRHLYRGPAYHHPHYLQGDLYTGATRAFWIDSLSAYYPGLLTLAGELDEAIEAHMLYTALWTRYSALPERWSVASGSVEGGLRWWGGRPEFIESTYHLYQATRDPWYLHVGEMALRDIKRRCWTKCGWAGLQDVSTGEQIDRMESFFLGETTKYLFLLFHSAHPLNTIDAPYVFNTEGHPLIIPRRKASAQEPTQPVDAQYPSGVNNNVCPVPPANVPFSFSATAARQDLFHASSLARLHLVPKSNVQESPLFDFSREHPSITLADLHSPSNHSFYPWTLPPYLMPINGTSSKLALRPTFDISFPVQPNTILGLGTLQRVQGGILVNNLGGLRIGMVHEDPDPFDTTGRANGDHYRVYSIGNVPLGRDERLFLPKDVLTTMVTPTDPNFTTVQDSALLDLIIESATPTDTSNSTETNEPLPSAESSPGLSPVVDSPELLFTSDEVSVDDELSSMKAAFNSFIQHVTNLMHEHPTPTPQSPPASKLSRESFSAILPIGIGAAPLPDMDNVPSPGTATEGTTLPWTTIYIADELCSEPLSPHVPQDHQILVIRRGTCSFSRKLSNIPSFTPSSTSLQLVIVVSFLSHDPLDDNGNVLEGVLVRPLLDEEQRTEEGEERADGGVSMIMVGGGEEMMRRLQRARGVSVRRKWEIWCRGTV